MNGFRICVLQDLSHILSAKSLQHETLASTNTFQRCLWSFLNASKEENACETKKINSLAAWITLPVMMTLNFRLPMTFSRLKINTEVKRLKALKPLTKYNDLLSLLDKSLFRNKCHTILPNVLAGDFSFIRGNNKVAIDKTDYRDCVSKIFSHQENRTPVRCIDLRMEKAWSNNSSTCITARNLNNFSLIKSKFKNINQQHSKDQFKSQNDQFSQRRTLPQSSELQFRDVKGLSKDLFFNTIKPRTQQQTILYSTSSRNQGSQKLSSCLTSMPRRAFSTKSCIVIQKSIQTASRKDLNISSLRLKSTSYSGCVSLARLQSFSHDAKSEKSGNCKKSHRKNRCEESNVRIKKNRSRQRDTRNEKNVPSQNDISKKRRKNESCERYICPELQRKWKCQKERSDEKTHQNCDDSKRRSATNHARQSKDSKCSQKQDVEKKLPTCKRRETREKRRVICTDSSKGKNNRNRESKCKKNHEKHEIREEGRQKCMGNNRGRSKNYQKRNSSCEKSKTVRDNKRHYSQQSVFSTSRDYRSFSTLIPDIVFDTNGTKKTTQRFYTSCNKDEKDLKPSCEKPKKKYDTEKEDETRKKCVKDPPKCLTRKSIADKKQTCQSTPKDEDMKSHEPAQKSRHEEYCSNRKAAFAMKDKFCDKKPKEELTKEHPPSITKDKKPVEKSIKEQIDREYKEIDECKQIGITKKNDKDKIKKMSAEYSPIGSDGMIIPYEQRKENNEKFTSMPNKSIACNSTVALHKSSRKIHEEIPIMARDVRLFDMMFDRSFSTTKVNYQDDFAIEQTAGHSKMVQRRSANNSEFIHGDELPSYIEVENDEEEDDEYDWVTSRPIHGLNRDQGLE